MGEAQFNVCVTGAVWSRHGLVSTMVFKDKKLNTLHLSENPLKILSSAFFWLRIDKKTRLQTLGFRRIKGED